VVPSREKIVSDRYGAFDLGLAFGVWLYADVETWAINGPPRAIIEKNGTAQAALRRHRLLHQRAL
jgi:hypothetical protein